MVRIVFGGVAGGVVMKVGGRIIKRGHRCGNGLRMQASVSHERQGMRDERASMGASDVQGHVAGIYGSDWQRCPVCRVPVIKLRCRSCTSATASATGGPCLGQRRCPRWLGPRWWRFVVRPEHDLTAQSGGASAGRSPRQASELGQAKSIRWLAPDIRRHQDTEFASVERVPLASGCLCAARAALGLAVLIAQEQREQALVICTAR